jgi:phage tail sheath protein FI
MATRPGVSIIQRSTPPVRSAPTDTGVWFVAGLADAGPVTPTLIRSMADYERIFGQRVSYSILYDALDVFFREGGNRAYVSRVVGPNAVTASHNLVDGAAAISLIVDAIGPGSSGDNYKVGVRAGVGGGTFVIFVQDAVGNEIETSPDLADNNAAVLWAQGSSYIRLTLGASANDPAVAAAAALAGGDDDRANITDTEWATALGNMSIDLGIGQVSAPGRTSDVGHQQLLDHAGANRRTAILDAPDSATQGTLTASAAAVTGDERFGGMFWPWLVVPGVISGTTRTVPPSALVAGKLAANDASGLGANSPAAGVNGIASYAVGLSQDPNALDRETLNDSGVDVIREMFGSVRVYGWRSLVDPNGDPGWVDLGNARLYMALAGEGAAIGEQFMFDKIDGQGKAIAAFNGALAAMLARYYQNGDLYGASASDAFFVDTGAQVNTDATLAANELHAVLNVRMSPFAELVEIEIYKRPITEGVTS